MHKRHKPIKKHLIQVANAYIKLCSLIQLDFLLHRNLQHFQFVK